jgi:hypothetical protein
MSGVWALGSRMAQFVRLSQVAAALVLGLGTASCAGSESPAGGSQSDTVTLPAPPSSAPSTSPKDIWSQVRVTSAFDSGSTYEGSSTAQFIVDQLVDLPSIIDQSHLAIRAQVATIYPSHLNTESGDFEISKRQRAADVSAGDFPTFDALTTIDLDVTELLGSRPDSPIQVGETVQIEAAGGAVTLRMPVELAERLRMYERRADGGGTTPPPPDGTVEVLVAQAMQLHWNEGDDVIVFLNESDIVLATWTGGQPDTRRAVRITSDPAGGFRVEDDLAVPKSEIVAFEPFPIAVVTEMAQELNDAPLPSVPADLTN